MKKYKYEKYYNKKSFCRPDYWPEAVMNTLAGIVNPKHFPIPLLEAWLNRRFYMRMGRHMDFKQPKTFNEKTQWYKIHYRNPELTEIADKIQFKSYIERKLGEGYTAKLYATWYKPTDIDFRNLTPPYVIKSNCCAEGHNILFILDDKYDKNQVRNTVETWFHKDSKYVHTTICGDKYAYWDISPAVLVEEYVPGIHTGATDYKFFCFDGIPQCIVAIEGRFEQEKSETRYDMDWNIINLSCNNDAIKPLTRPPHFEEMKSIALKLAKGFPFVRVDFYDTEKGPLLSEMTFYSGGGYNKYNPESYDAKLGQFFTLRKYEKEV